jgi:bis(5'-nucleosyl)-tetraphosphatase (symmetrical)
MLRWAKEHSQEIILVLGNHDLHFLGRYFGVVDHKSGDTLEELLQASDAKDLAQWLASQPLLHISGGFVLVHAGILPKWDLGTATDLAHQAELLIRGQNLHFLRRRWTETGSQPGELRSAGSAARILTHLRCCKSAALPCYHYSGSPAEAPPTCTPWFEYREIRSLEKIFIFGHWAQLGFYRNANAVCMDSGCVYGGYLSALRLDDGTLYQLRYQG